jgi:outer membrane protein TolC
MREQAEILRIFEEQLESGRVAAFVVYRGRAELADAQQRYNRTRASLTEAEAALKATLGVSVVSHFTYPEIPPLPRPRDTDLETDIRLGLSERPDLVASRHGVAQALYRIEAVEAEYLPQVYAGVQYQGMAMRPFNSGGGTYDGGFSGGLSVAIPIFDGGERRARLNKEKAGGETRQLQLREAELEVTRQVTASRARWEAADSNVELAYHEVKQAEEDLRIARLRSKVGRSIHLEILDALEATSRARLNLLAAQHDASVAHAELLLATGVPNYPLEEAQEGPPEPARQD